MKDQDKSSKEKLSEPRRQTDDAFHASELRYRRLFESAQDAILILDFDTGKILDVNPFLIDMLGYSHEEFIEKYLWEVSPFKDTALNKEAFAKLQQAGYVRYEDLPLETSDGRRIAVEFVSNSYPVNGKTFIQCNIRDITKRKHAVEAAKRANEEWQRTFNAISDLVMVLDNRHTILRANKAMADALGMTEQEVVGKSCHELVHGGKEPLAFCPHSQLLADGKEHSVEVEEPRLGGIYDVRVSPLFGQDGEIIGSVHINRDITVQKKAEQALREGEQRYRTLFEESIDGVYSVLRDGEIADANPSFSEIFGYTREELIGKDIRDLFVDPADRPKFQEEIEKKGFVKDYAIKYRKRDGTEMECLSTSSVYYREDGSIAGYRGIMRDVTDQKRLQRELLHAQKMESIGTLAGGIAHDFNNLLTVVLGFSELLLIGKNEQDPSYEDLQKIHQAARNGADLVKRILAFSRKAEINPRPVNLNQEIERIRHLLTRTISKMIGIELVLSDEPAIVHVDPSQLEQIVLNLAVNAQDAMPDGGILTFETMHVTLDEEYCGLHVGAKPGDYVMLSVSDTGHGMDHETLNHIFEPFYTTKETGKGTGLGLAMAYGIVKQHGGYIIGYSEPGMGTTFKIYLPVIPTETKPETPTEKLILPPGTETVLLVDDEEMLRDLGKRILERSGYTVLAAANGKEALDLYEKERNKISLVILDLIMPEMGGRQCLEELLKIDPQVRVLIATGYSAVGETKKTIESGAMGFVGKPYDMRQVLQAVRQALDQD